MLGCFADFLDSGVWPLRVPVTLVLACVKQARSSVCQPMACSPSLVVPPWSRQPTATELELAKQYEAERGLPHNPRCVVYRAGLHIDSLHGRHAHASAIMMAEAELSIKAAAEAALLIKPVWPKRPHAPDLR